MDGRIVRICAADTLILRQKVLRPLWRIEDCLNPEDNAATTMHFGFVQAERIVSVATFVLQSHPELHGGCPYRLRGMATAERARGHGFGGLLVRHGVEVLRASRCDLIWFNARIKAFEFYSRQGFSFHGPLFDIKEIGLHKVMYKHLIPR